MRRSVGAATVRERWSYRSLTVAALLRLRVMSVLEESQHWLAGTQGQRLAQHVVNFLIERNAQGVEHGGGEVIRADRQLGGIGSGRIGAAVDLSAADAGAGHQH